jgi:sec-independent protein translocase protein TatC
MAAPAQVPGPDGPDPEQHRMPLMAHLIELRNRVVVSAVALGIGMVIGLIFAEDLFDLLRAPIQAVFHTEAQNRMDTFYLWLTGPINAVVPRIHVEGSLNIANSPLEGMYSYFQVGLIGGALLASPVIAWQLWRFIAPGLYMTEKRYVLPLAMASSGLFGTGVLFCYAIMFPVIFPFFLTQLTGVTAVVSVQGYLESIVWMMLGMGVCFQLPVIVWFLAKIGLIDHRDMIKWLRYAIVGIFVAAAVVTPTSDIFTQTVVAVPLMGLYVVGIGVAWFSSTKVREAIAAP